MRTVYTFLRQDLTEREALEQVGNSCLLAGAAYHPDPKINHVFLSLRDERHFFDVRNYLQDHEIKHEYYYENKDSRGLNLGWTALTTEPLSPDKFEIFKGFVPYKPMGRVERFLRWFGSI